MGRKKKNSVYSKFDLLEDGTSKCTMCNKVLKSKYASNLIKHLRTHKDAYEEVTVLNRSRSALDESSTRTKIYKSVLQECTNLVAIHGRPLAMLEDAAFKNIIAMTGCKETINTHLVRQNIKEMAAKKRLDLARELQNKLLSLKADVASNSSRSYLGLNVQFIENGQIFLKNLAMIELKERHTADYLKEQVLQTLLRYRLDINSLYSVTTDNGANVIKMTRLLSDHLGQADHRQIQQQFPNENRPFHDLDLFVVSSDSETETTRPNDDGYAATDSDDDYDGDTELLNNFNDDVFPIVLNTFENQNIHVVRCAAHTIQLAVLDTLKRNDIKEVISCARNVVKTLRTPSYINKLKSKKQKLPILDCPTRWNSTLNMIERLISLKEICKADPLTNLSNEVWLQLDLIKVSLEPAKKLTIFLQKEQLLMGDFYIGWLTCKFELRRINNTLSSNLKSFMEEREILLYDSDAFLNAIFLDPRVNSTLRETQRIRAKNNLKSLYNRICMLDNKENHTQDNQLVVPSSSSTNENSSINEEVQDFLNTTYIDTHHDNIHTLLQRDADIEILEHQIDLFLQEPLNPATENILQYWEKNKFKFSKVYNLALIVLACPATQVSVERLFSGLRFVLTHLRNNLKSDLIEDIMVLRTNYLYGKK